MSEAFEIPEADWAAVGAVGEPGHRTFYLQAGDAEQIVTLKLEKQHVEAMTQFLAEILADLPAPDPHPAGATTADLREPVEADWAAGAIRLSYDGEADRVFIVVEEIETVDETGAEVTLPDAEEGIAAIGITRRQAAAIVAAGEQLLSTGRPTCPLCGKPMDPEGHSCPRTNGHRAH